jgi:hypothetical protein
MITHNDTGSTAACISFINIFRQVLEMKVAPDPEWWLNTYVQTARELEFNAAYSPRGGEFRNYSGPIWRFVEEKVADAYRNKLSTLEACNSWYSGAYLLETIPCVIYILMQHGHDPEEAIVRAVNDTRDGDTVAAIVGAAVGALHGKERLPKRWLDNLLGRTSYDDDGRIYDLLTKAKSVFWDQTIVPIATPNLSVQESVRKPFARSYVVVRDMLWGGCYPGDKNPAMERSKLDGLLDCGIGLVINLMEPGELSHGGEAFVAYERKLKEAASLRGLDIEVAHYPIPDNCIPSNELMDQILAAIDDSIQRGIPVFVHCWGGKGRTGTVIGCYLARRGIAVGSAALAKIRELRENSRDPKAYSRSPSTSDQIKMVMSWPYGTESRENGILHS